MTINAERFGVLERFGAVCASLRPIPDNSRSVHCALMNALVDAGYFVEHEYSVQLPSGRGGRIDLVATDSCGVRIAVEIDARRPRQKSIEKLQAEDDWLRVSCLRGVQHRKESYPGLDGIFALPVRLVTKQEMDDLPSIASVGRHARFVGEGAL